MESPIEGLKWRISNEESPIEGLSNKESIKPLPKARTGFSISALFRAPELGKHK